MVRILRTAALVFCLILLTGCVATGEWGEEMVYVRVDNGTTTLDYAVMNDGDIVSLSAEGAKEHDFSSYKTGDVLRVEVSQILETFPARVLFTRCEQTGKTAEIKLNESSQSWADENNWIFVE